MVPRVGDGDPSFPVHPLWDHGRLVAAGVRFDVLRLDIGDLVRAVSPLLGYVDIADGAQLPGATAARPRTGDTGLCGWWKFVTRGRGLWLLQSVGRRAPLCSDVQAGDMDLDWRHSAGISCVPTGDRVTAFFSLPGVSGYCVFSGGLCSSECVGLVVWFVELVYGVCVRW